MKSIVDMFTEALIRRRERGYKRFYIAVDLHGTIFRPSKITKMEYDKEENVFFEHISEVGNGLQLSYPFAVEVLRHLSSCSECCLILWTSSTEDNANMACALLKDSGITVSYVNENPECNGNEYSDFGVKFCFDILLDDKAGFEPETDWKALWDFIRTTDWTEFYERVDKKISKRPDIFGSRCITRA